MQAMPSVLANVESDRFSLSGEIHGLGVEE